MCTICYRRVFKFILLLNYLSLIRFFKWFFICSVTNFSLHNLVTCNKNKNLYIIWYTYDIFLFNSYELLLINSRYIFLKVHITFNNGHKKISCVNFYAWYSLNVNLFFLHNIYFSFLSYIIFETRFISIKYMQIKFIFKYRS